MMNDDGGWKEPKVFSIFRKQYRSSKSSIFVSNSFCFFITSFTHTHCMKSVPIRSYSGPYFPAFRLNTEIYSVSLRIQCKCEKIRTRITPNIDTSYTETKTDIDTKRVIAQVPFSCHKNRHMLFRLIMSNWFWNNRDKDDFVYS